VGGRREGDAAAARAGVGRPARARLLGHGAEDAGSPERPRYVLAGTRPRWLDLEGYHTRPGDVRPLSSGWTTAT
jgi:hypothetical protein